MASKETNVCTYLQLVAKNGVVVCKYEEVQHENMREFNSLEIFQLRIVWVLISKSMFRN